MKLEDKLALRAFFGRHEVREKEIQIEKARRNKNYAPTSPLSPQTLKEK